MLGVNDCKTRPFPRSHYVVSGDLIAFRPHSNPELLPMNLFEHGYVSEKIQARIIPPRHRHSNFGEYMCPGYLRGWHILCFLFSEMEVNIMVISIINCTDGTLSDEEIMQAIRAINRQIEQDFEPYWSFGASLRLEGRSGKKPQAQRLEDLRGDAVIYLWNEVDEAKEALGYHDRNNLGIPYGFVFTEISKELGEAWTVTLSHEALELVGDAQANLLVAGPHPRNPKKTVFHWFEMCDAVQAETYLIDSVEVSNFVLPLYFTGEEELGGRNDFLARVHNGKPLRSFSVNPGGYIGFFDPAQNKNDTFMPDDLAKKRMVIKNLAKGARRSARYKLASTLGNKRMQKLLTYR